MSPEKEGATPPKFIPPGWPVWRFDRLEVRGRYCVRVEMPYIPASTFIIFEARVV
jgi:hypothetical protein